MCFKALYITDVVKKSDKQMTNILCNTYAAPIQKYEEASPIRIEINHGNFIISLLLLPADHLCRYNVFNNNAT